MKKTVLIFKMFRILESYVVDPNSIYIGGWFNWNLVNDFLFGEKEQSNLPELIDGMPENVPFEIELEVWEDSDDYRSWLDFKVINTEAA